MLNNKEARGVVSRVVDPVAKGLLSIGLTPDAVTYIGAAGVSLSALWFFPRGQFVIGVLVILLFVFSDLLDGTMARLSGRAGPWGNYLDSTLDRVADGAVFGGVLIYFATRGDSWATAAAWVCLVGGFTVSYAKARAESVGAEANVGIAERAERLIVILVAAFITGLGITWLLPVATGVLAVLTLITIAQRFTHVRQQLVRRHPDSDPAAAVPGTATGAATGTPGTATGAATGTAGSAPDAAPPRTGDTVDGSAPVGGAPTSGAGEHTP